MGELERAIAPRIMFGKVMHARLFPKRNKFRYRMYYLELPLADIEKFPIVYNRFGLLSFYDKDHGPRDGTALEPWARGILKSYGLGEVCSGAISLITLPRVLGYVFNPVSFWVCRDKDGYIRAVICEVHNTFGEYHSYICAHDDHRPITEKDTLEGEKLFHVSPFIIREGRYTFRFDLRDGHFGIWIDYYAPDGNKQLLTSLIGKREPLDKAALRKAFWRYPLVTFKAIYLIHWQALKLIGKGIKYIPRPSQRDEITSGTDKITKL